jgi:hypothetical protein
MKKKQTVATKILHLLNTIGGLKPKDIIKETKLKPASVYTTLNVLRNEKKIAKEEDGVYISQTQTSTTPVSKSTNTKRMPLYNERSSGSMDNILKENKQLTEWTQMWKQKYDKLEQDYTQAKIMYLDSQAVVKYLEEKVAQLIRG